MLLENNQNILPKMKKKYKIMIVVGEMSGDSHAAKLIAALRQNYPAAEFEFFGTTGEKMRAAGVETLEKADDFARVGIIEVATALPMFWKVFRKVKKEAFKRKPDAVILVDFPDFNLRLATALKKKNIKTIYYISPQVWAWKKHRVKRIKKDVDLLLTILPFEQNWYAEHGFEKLKYVGNPLAGEVKSKSSRIKFCAENDLDNEKPIIALLPGSRGNEIDKILPVLIETACLMSSKKKDLQFVIALAAIRKKSEVKRIVSEVEACGFKIPKCLSVVKEATYEALHAADAAAVASGTATLEAAIIGTPMAIVYKVSNLTYYVLKNFVSIEFIGLVNLIAREKVAAEFIQNDFTAEILSRELFRLLEKNVNDEMRKKLAHIKQILGSGGASKLAAEAVMNELSKTNR